MQEIHLFELASRQAEWLSVRQATISGNVANANTPGFKARDVEPFKDVLEQTQLTMTATNSKHLEINASGIAATALRKDEVTEQNHSKTRSVSNRKWSSPARSTGNSRSTPASSKHFIA